MNLPPLDPAINLTGYVLIFPSPVGSGVFTTMWSPTESGSDALLQKYAWKHVIKMSARDAYAALLAASTSGATNV